MRFESGRMAILSGLPTITASLALRQPDAGPLCERLLMSKIHHSRGAQQMTAKSKGFGRPKAHEGSHVRPAGTSYLAAGSGCRSIVKPAGAAPRSGCWARRQRESASSPWCSAIASLARVWAQFCEKLVQARSSERRRVSIASIRLMQCCHFVNS